MSPSVPSSTESDPKQPWLGLAAYSETDSELFKGREQEVLDLLRLVRREVLTVLFGPSGMGKTSLLNAGLFPRLREFAFLPVAIRLDHSGDQPNYVGQIRARIAATLHADTAHPIEEEALAKEASIDQETLWEYFHRVVFWDSRNNLVIPVLVFDQFEEIFTLGRSRAATDEFLISLADLIENYIPTSARLRMENLGRPIPIPHEAVNAKVVLSMREDFVWRLDSMRKAMPSVMHNRFSIARMNGEQALRAVLEPGKGIVDSPVALQIVRFVAAANQPSPTTDSQEAHLNNLQVDPALLSVVCRELNGRRIQQDKGQLTEDLLEQAGTNILDDFYEGGFDGLDSLVRVFVEDRLLTASGFRGTVPLEEALQVGIGPEAIRSLVDRRLIRTEKRLGIPHLELTHDLLTKVVQRSKARRQERDERERERQQREAEELERARLEEHRQAELRRTRRLLVIVSGAAVICLVFGLLAFLSFRQARDAMQQFKAAKISAETAARTAESSKKLAENLKDDAEAETEKAFIAEGEANDYATRAEQERRMAVSRQLAAQASLLRKDQIALSLLLSWASYTIAATNEAKSAMLAGLIDSGRLITILRAHAAAVESIAFQPTGRMFATGDSNGGVVLWDITSSRPIGSPLLGLHSAVKQLVFSADGGAVAGGGEDGEVVLWDLGSEQGTILRKENPKEPVAAIGFRSDNKSIWTSTGGSLSVFDWKSHQWHTANLPAPLHSVFAFNQNGTRCIWRDGKGSLLVWDSLTGVATPVAQTLDASSPIAVGPAGTTVAGIANGSVIVWDVSKPNAPGMRWPASPAFAYELRFSQDGKTLAARTSGSIQLWEIEHYSTMTLGIRGSTTMAFSPDAKSMVSGGCESASMFVFEDCTEGEVRLWNLENPWTVARRLSGHEAAVTRVNFHPNGDTVASGDREGRILVQNILSGDTLANLDLGGNPVYSLTFNLNGDLLAAGSDGVITIFDARAHYDAIKLVVPGGGEVGAIRFSRDGRRLAVASFNNPSEGHLSITWWDLPKKRLLGRSLSALIPCPWRGGGRWFQRSVEFSPDASRLAVAYLDPEKRGSESSLTPSIAGQARSRITLYETSRGRLLHSVTGSSVIAPAVAFSDDGKILVVGSTSPNAEATLTVLDVVTFRQLGPIVGRRTGPVDLVVAGRTTVLAAGTAVTEKLGEIGVSTWDIQTGEQLSPTLPAGNTSVAWSQMRNTLVLGDIAGNVWVWNLNPGALRTQLCNIANRNLTKGEQRKYLGRERIVKTCPNLP